MKKSIVSFGELATGTDFFDPESGEYFTKVNMHEAKCFSGGDVFMDKLSPFGQDEKVEIK